MTLEEDATQVDLELLAMFLDDTEEGLLEVDALMPRLGRQGDGEAVAAVFRIVHTVKGVAGFIPLPDVVTLTHRMESLLDAVRQGRAATDEPLTSVLYAGFDMLRAMVATIRAEATLPLATPAGLPALLQALEASQQRIDAGTDVAAGPSTPDCPHVTEPGTGPPCLLPQASETPTERSPQRTGSTGRTMRIDEERIDEFLAYVSEFIVLREMFDHVGARLRADIGVTPAMQDFQRARQSLTALSGDLQRSIMSIRKVPVKGLLQKVPRIVREVTTATGKRAELVLLGEDVRIDKSLLQLLEAPLMHIVRNAVDHGIETAALRAQRGKPPEARVEVRAHETACEIRLSVRDDGGGIDGKRLRDKAVAMGILPAQQADQLSDEDSYPLLFAPGLSTASQVTDISGRGVGMDVVHRAVADAGGRIEIATKLGSGTTFTICLPTSVTVQILEGFVVEVGGQRYVLPLNAVQECFQVPASQRRCLPGDLQCVTRGDRLVVMRSLTELLGTVAGQPGAEGTVVSLRFDDGTLAGLAVDRIVGVQQVVLRDVPYLDSFDTPFCGGVVLGDGRVAMMLDVNRLRQRLVVAPANTRRDAA